MLRWLGYALTVSLLLVGAISLGLLSHYLVHSHEYRFGTEVAGWRYGSARYFVLFALSELSLAISGLTIARRVSSIFVRVLIQATILLIALSSAALTM